MIWNNINRYALPYTKCLSSQGGTNRMEQSKPPGHPSSCQKRGITFVNHINSRWLHPCNQIGLLIKFSVQWWPLFWYKWNWQQLQWCQLPVIVHRWGHVRQHLCHTSWWQWCSDVSDINACRSYTCISLLLVSWCYAQTSAFWHLAFVMCLNDITYDVTVMSVASFCYMLRMTTANTMIDTLNFKSDAH